MLSHLPPIFSWSYLDKRKVHYVKQNFLKMQIYNQMSWPNVKWGCYYLTKNTFDVFVKNYFIVELNKTENFIYLPYLFIKPSETIFHFCLKKISFFFQFCFLQNAKAVKI